MPVSAAPKGQGSSRSTSAEHDTARAEVTVAATERHRSASAHFLQQRSVSLLADSESVPAATDEDQEHRTFSQDTSLRCQGSASRVHLDDLFSTLTLPTSCSGLEANQATAPLDRQTCLDSSQHVDASALQPEVRSSEEGISAIALCEQPVQVAVASPGTMQSDGGAFREAQHSGSPSGRVPLHTTQHGLDSMPNPLFESEHQPEDTKARAPVGDIATKAQTPACQLDMGAADFSALTATAQSTFAPVPQATAPGRPKPSMRTLSFKHPPSLEHSSQEPDGGRTLRSLGSRMQRGGQGWHVLRQRIADVPGNESLKCGAWSGNAFTAQDDADDFGVRRRSRSSDGDASEQGSSGVTTATTSNRNSFGSKRSSATFARDVVEQAIAREQQAETLASPSMRRRPSHALYECAHLALCMVSCPAVLLR